MPEWIALGVKSSTTEAFWGARAAVEVPAEAPGLELEPPQAARAMAARAAAAVVLRSPRISGRG